MSSDKTPRKDRNAGYTLTPEFHRTPLGENQKINNCQQRNESRSKFSVDILSEDVALNTPTTSNLQTAQAVCEETAINATILRQNVGKSCVVQTPVDSTLQSEHFQSSQYCHEVSTADRLTTTYPRRYYRLSPVSPDQHPCLSSVSPVQLCLSTFNEDHVRSSYLRQYSAPALDATRPSRALSRAGSETPASACHPFRSTPHVDDECGCEELEIMRSQWQTTAVDYSQPNPQSEYDSHRECTMVHLQPPFPQEAASNSEQLARTTWWARSTKMTPVPSVTATRKSSGAGIDPRQAFSRQTQPFQAGMDRHVDESDRNWITSKGDFKRIGDIKCIEVVGAIIPTDGRQTDQIACKISSGTISDTQEEMTAQVKNEANLDITALPDCTTVHGPFPWSSFYEESAVPDFPYRLESRRQTGREKVAKLVNATTTNSPLENLDSRKMRVASYLVGTAKRKNKISRCGPLEKSVTWKDNKKSKHPKAPSTASTIAVVSEEPLKPKTEVAGVADIANYEIPANEANMNELISILSDLCDSLSRHHLVNTELPYLVSEGETQVPAHLEFPMRENRQRYEHLKERKEKVIVEVRVVFLKIGEIDTLKEYYQADAFLQAKWREPKLDGKNQEYLGRTDLDLYWNPLCYVDNILSETKEVRWLSTQTKPNGEVYIVDRRRVRGVFLETLELNDFPLDVQDLTITVTSERPDSEVDLIPDNSEMSAINSQTFVDQQEWKLHEHVEITKRVITQEYSRSMQSHSCISVTCRAARRPGYFYWNVFLIMFMISGLAFATFAVSLDKAELRLRLSFTLILTSVTFKYVITQNLPRISYLTYTDKYVLMSLAILCIISVWHAVITILTISAPAVSNTTVSQSFANASHLLRHSDKDGVLPGVSAKPPENQATYGEQKFDSNFPSGNQNSPLAEDSILKPRSKTYLGGSQKLDSSSSGSTRGVELGDFTVTDEMVSVYFLRLLKAYMDAQDQLEFSPEFVDTKQRGRLEVMKRLEQDVFISFVILYVIAHSVFGFWLYFDACRRRREMHRKDREYRFNKAFLYVVKAPTPDGIDGFRV